MTVLLFALSALIWGTGAYVTTLQAGIVPVPVSVAYRMLLMAAAMLVLVLATGTRFRLTRQDLPWMAIHAASFFALNFTCFYYSTHWVPSGVAALALSTSPIFSTIIALIVLRERVSVRAVGGMLLGIAGLALIVAPDLKNLSLDGNMVKGMSWALGASFFTAVGTIIGARNHRAGLSPYTANFWGGLAGAAICALIAFGNGMEFTIDLSTHYLASLAYLGIVASGGAFVIFFKLVARAGPARASYSFTVVPVISLIVSVFLENVVMSPLMLAGAAMTLIGNVLVLRR